MSLREVNNLMRIIRWVGIAIAAAAGLAALAGRTRAEIHNGGVDCTNWNGTYSMLGSYAKDPALAPRGREALKIHQTACNGVDMETTIGGEHVTIIARTNDRDNNRSMSIRGRTVRVYATWVDGYGRNWEVALIPDPLRPNVRYSRREFLLTSYHTVIEQATIHDPSHLEPLATFGGNPGGRGGGGEKIHDIVDARTVYAMPVNEEENGTSQPSRVELRHRRR